MGGSTSSSLAPVIIIGMHRSGTSMITRILETMGLFVGIRKEENHEALFFLRINEWLVAQCGGSWEYPEPIYDLIENAPVRAMTTDYISRYLLASPRAVSFLGWRKYLRYRTPARLDIPWGWKNPLNTYALPLWLDLFPEAKVIHIYRHGVDVANSLRARVRRETRRTPIQQLYDRWRFLHWMRPKAGGFINGFRCASLEGGLSLWEEYVTEARRHMRDLDGRGMELKYEDFLAKPRDSLRKLAIFCNLSLSDSALDQAANQVREDRAYAFMANPELSAFANRVSDRLSGFSY